VILPVAYLETGGRGHIDGHKNLTIFFGKLTSVDFFFRRTTNLATFFLLTFSNSRPQIRPTGGHPPFHLSSSPQKFSHPKAGDHGPPKYTPLDPPLPFPFPFPSLSSVASIPPTRDCNPGIRDPGLFLNPEIPGLDSFNPGIDSLAHFCVMITVSRSILATAN
jgi:hypothetical protein